MKNALSSKPFTPFLLTVLFIIALIVSIHTTTAAPNQPDLATACAQVERDENTGAPTRLFNCGTLPPANDAVTAAKMLLSTNAKTLGLTANGNDLKTITVKEGLGSTHVRFQQTYRRVPVWLGEVAVHTGKNNNVQLVENKSFPALNLSTTPTVAAHQAESVAKIAIGLVRGQRGASSSTLVIYGNELPEPRLAWHVVVPALEPLGDWHAIVDAQTSSVITTWNAIVFDSATVYDPNAVQQTGNAALTDNNNANSATLAQARVTVNLQGIQPDQNKLVGSYVNLCAPGILGAYKPACQANNATRVYDYTRNDDKFEEATVYYALDSVQRYIQSLGFTNVLSNAIPVHAHFYSADNSFYSDGDKGLHFGDGGVDDAEDADVIIHEYGHAIQANQVPGWGPMTHTEQRAMGEGFGDYLAASFYSNQGLASYQTNHAPCVAEWDATSYAPNVNGTRCLRRTDGLDERTGTDIGKYKGTPTEEHADGRFWSAALWCIRAELGRENTDRLVLQSHFYITPDTSNQAFERGVDALQLADANLYGGANTALIQNCAISRRLLSIKEPTLIYPLGGETIEGNSIVTITWNTSNVPPATVYALETNNNCQRTGFHRNDNRSIENIWTPLATSTSGNTQYEWHTPNVRSENYCIRIRGQAPGYQESNWVTSQPFVIHVPKRAFLPALN